MQPDSSGNPVQTSSIGAKLKKGVTVQLKTLAADPSVKSVVTIAATVTLTQDVATVVGEGPCKDGGATICGTTATCSDYSATFTCSCKSGFQGSTTTSVAPTCTEHQSNPVATTAVAAAATEGSETGIVIIIIVLLVGGAGAFGAYRWKHQAASTKVLDGTNPTTISGMEDVKQTEQVCM